MNKKIILLALAVILAVGIIFAWQYWNKDFLNEPANSNNQIQQKEQVEKAFLRVNFGDEKISETEINFVPGATAFELTKLGIEKLGFTMTAKDSAYGVLVEEINGYKSGEDGKYWLYYQNGETAPTSADKLEIKAGDKIEWKFEKPTF